MPLGRIVKVVSNFYTVDTGTVMYSCKPRGLFKRQGLTPMVGDWVTFEVEAEGVGWMTTVHPRNNRLVRPPVANMEQAVLVCSVANPPLNLSLLDKFLVQVEYTKLFGLICLTKWDLCENEEGMLAVAELYRRIGYPVFAVSVKEGLGIMALRERLKCKISVLAGPSGVGKSSLLNSLIPDAQMQTGEVSQKLGRGRHTTRHVELLRMDEQSYVVDTPGFSQLDFQEVALEELSWTFREFREPAQLCRYRGCTHDREPDCAVKAAVEEGRISPSRYEHYKLFLGDLLEREKRRY